MFNNTVQLLYLQRAYVPYDTNGISTVTVCMYILCFLMLPIFLFLSRQDQTNFKKMLKKNCQAEKKFESFRNTHTLQ